MGDLWFKGGPDNGVAAAVGPYDPAQMKAELWESEEADGRQSHRPETVMSMSDVLSLLVQGSEGDAQRAFRRWHDSRGIVAVKAGGGKPTLMLCRRLMLSVIGLCLDMQHDGSGVIAFKHDLASMSMKPGLSGVGR